MRVVSNPGIAERADKVVRIIVDTYVLPNKSFQEVLAMMQSGALDPLRDFSEACELGDTFCRKVSSCLSGCFSKCPAIGLRSATNTTYGCQGARS
jgi:hypothetical protein